MDKFNWTTLLFSDVSNIPSSVTGVYFIMLNDNVVYIGQSRNIKYRLKNHNIICALKKFHNLHNIKIGFFESKKRTMDEDNAIRHYKPALNVHGIFYGSKKGRLSRKQLLESFLQKSIIN
jgi:predicted GIY-YIG superfamily endonuclease